MPKKTIPPHIPIRVERTEPAPPKIKRLATMADMDKVFMQPILLRVTFEKEEYEIEARRLTPGETAKLDEITNRVIPPIVKGKTIEEDRPDYANADFLKLKAAANIEARALAIYWCVPAFRSGWAEGYAPSTAEVVAFVQGKLNDQMLEFINQAVRSSGVDLAQLVNFS